MIIYYVNTRTYNDCMNISNSEGASTICIWENWKYIPIDCFPSLLDCDGFIKIRSNFFERFYLFRKPLHPLSSFRMEHEPIYWNLHDIERLSAPPGGIWSRHLCHSAWLEFDLDFPRNRPLMWSWLGWRQDQRAAVRRIRQSYWTYIWKNDLYFHQNWYTSFIKYK